MSWLLGNRYKEQPQNFSQFVNPPASGGSGDGDDGSKDDKKLRKSMEAYTFDSSALERAAAAAKELERSAHAKEALELAKMQENTRQIEMQSELKKYEAGIEQMKVEQKRIDGEERRKTLQEETKQHQVRAQYQDQLARKRYDEQLAQQQRMNEENLRRQEESVAKQEALRKATIEHEMELKNKNEMKRLEMEMKAKAKLKRETLDLTLEKMRLKAKEQRETTLESLKLFGLGTSEFLQDRNKILSAVGGLTLLAVGIYAAKGSIGTTFRYIEARLQKPTLVRETSRISPLEFVQHPINTVKKLRDKFRGTGNDALAGIVLSPKIEERMRDVAIATKNTKRNKGTFRNLLMYGPPGTGKTLFARMLAHHSGLDYAIVAGGDFAPLGKDGVTEIHKIFDWASTSHKGLMLFVDEAEAFLRNRRSGNGGADTISMDQRMMLSAFLEKTGTPNTKFMLVLASNVPEEFDSALMDRIDDKVGFELPGPQERERLVRMYFEKYVLQPAAEGRRRFKVQPFDYGAFCTKVAKMTDGFSGRELAKLGVAWQTAIDASVDGVLTEEMALERCRWAVEEHQKTMEMQSKPWKSSQTAHLDTAVQYINPKTLVINITSRRRPRSKLADLRSEPSNTLSAA